ncbi:hypothetical protein PV325_005270 [Microctonus aethiopoides]|nr:hypothetical protein PV325_005270 [Microctonus aethiopoides]
MSSDIPTLYQPVVLGLDIASVAFDPVSKVTKPVASAVEMLGLVEKTVQFLLYTQSNEATPYFLKVGNVDNLNKSPFDPTSETKIIIHGYIDSSALDPFLHCLSKNYLKKKNYNVIIVDYSLLNKFEPTITVEVSHAVGEYIGKMVEFLETDGGLLLSDLHVIGHSLGAHVAGFTGAYMSGNIGRITGLDAGGPTFETPHLNDPKDRLDETDAVFVDSIHTCIGIVGFIQPIGHIDFYPNGGLLPQPGCPPADPTVLCSHLIAFVFMFNSIKYPDQFDAVECDSWENYKKGSCSDNSIAKMGEYVDRNARGKYYLETSPSIDFC